MNSGLITVNINGEVQACPPGLNLIELLGYLNLNPRLVAIEYNGEIRHRQFWETTRVVENDRLEIVTIVGGGSVS
jgi:sulfur carrier protein